MRRVGHACAGYRLFNVGLRFGGASRGGRFICEKCDVEVRPSGALLHSSRAGGAERVNITRTSYLSPMTITNDDNM